MIEGGCFCRRIRYAIDDGNYTSVNCHCTMCRRLHAAPYVTWLIVSADGLHYAGARPERLSTSPGGSRDFCPTCGTHIACANAGHPGRIDVSVGSLDSPEAFAPTRDVFAGTRLSWAARAEAADA